MARYRGPKARLCRREGVNLFGSTKYTKILTKRPNGPGEPSKMMGKKSEYALQLREKQKLRYMFVLTETQFKRYFDKASRMTGVTSDNLMRQLELRLDNAIYRSGLALTRFQARQFSSHGLFLVNGRRVTIPSYKLKEGDKVEVRARSKPSGVFAGNIEELAGYNPPRWLEVDLKSLSFTVKALPEQQDFEQLVDTQKIIELYSR
jgi:small subunit ribosomal protein S4